MTSPALASGSLDDIRDAVSDWAARGELHLVPAVPDAGEDPTVVVDPDAMTARAFPDVAAAAATPRILYVRATQFDPDLQRREIEDAFESDVAVAQESGAATESPGGSAPPLPGEVLAHLAAAESHRDR